MTETDLAVREPSSWPSLARPSPAASRDGRVEFGHDDRPTLPADVRADVEGRCWDDVGSHDPRAASAAQREPRVGISGRGRSDPRSAGYRKSGRSRRGSGPHPAIRGRSSCSVLPAPGRFHATCDTPTCDPPARRKIRALAPAEPYAEALALPSERGYSSVGVVQRPFGSWS